jgi:hypothetical protein
MKKFIFIIIILIFISISFCITSQEIVIEYPEDADWTFSYFDAGGIHIGDGKAQIEFNAEEKKFNITLTEEAFGDTALIKGTIGEYNQETDTYNFTGEGEWFLGENFKYIGEFNSDFNVIYNGSIAYSISLDQEELQTILKKMEKYRNDIIQFQKLSKEEQDNTPQPEKPVLDDEYMSLIYTWKANLSPNNPE